MRCSFTYDSSSRGFGRDRNLPRALTTLLFKQSIYEASERAFSLEETQRAHSTTIVQSHQKSMSKGDGRAAISRNVPFPLTFDNNDIGNQIHDKIEKLEVFKYWWLQQWVKELTMKSYHSLHVLRLSLRGIDSFPINLITDDKKNHIHVSY